jgi:hypothetical protein
MSRLIAVPGFLASSLETPPRESFLPWSSSEKEIHHPSSRGLSVELRVHPLLVDIALRRKARVAIEAVKMDGWMEGACSYARKTTKVVDEDDQLAQTVPRYWISSISFS